MNFNKMQKLLNDANNDGKLLCKSIINVMREEKTKETVLGVDIFKYSKMNTIKQFVVYL
jgi:hypothetical protein